MPTYAHWYFRSFECARILHAPEAAWRFSSWLNIFRDNSVLKLFPDHLHLLFIFFSDSYEFLHTQIILCFSIEFCLLSTGNLSGITSGVGLVKQLSVFSPPNDFLYQLSFVSCNFLARRSSIRRRSVLDSFPVFFKFVAQFNESIDLRGYTIISHICPHFQN